MREESQSSRGNKACVWYRKIETRNVFHAVFEGWALGARQVLLAKVTNGVFVLCLPLVFFADGCRDTGIRCA